MLWPRSCKQFGEVLLIEERLGIGIMESSITDQQSLDADLQITEPHFDEEATVLSARPVVPIRTVTANPRFKRSWALGLALTGALSIGVIATALYYTRLKTETLTGADSQTISAGAEASSTVSDSANATPESVDGGAATPATIPPVGSKASARVVEKVRSVEPATRAKSSAEISTKAVAPRPVDRPVNVDDELRIPAQYDQREEDARAARRAERRERKRRERDERGSRSSDQVLRIREIFDGRRKP
jgi:hypothetical protein